MLRGFPRAPRVLVLTGPLFAPTALVGAFAVAYQDALGLTSAEIGLLAAAAAGLGFLFLLLGSMAAQRWGRLRAMTLFDLTGFVLPALLFAAARSPGEVVAAALLGATAQGAQAGFQGLLMAEAAPGGRQRVLAWEHLLLTLPSVAMPLLAGAWVQAWGLVPATRAMYLVGAASVAAMMVLRWWALRGHEARAAPAGPLLDLRGLRGAGITPLLAASALLAMASGLGVLAQVRVVRVAGIEAWWLGPFAFAVVAADLAATALAARAHGSPRAWTLAGAGFAAAGSLAFVVAREPALLLGSGALLGLAGAWLGVGTGALLHDAVPDRLRDQAVGAQLAARAVGGLAGPALGGLVYGLDQVLPWVLAAALFLSGGVLATLQRHPADSR